MSAGVSAASCAVLIADTCALFRPAACTGVTACRSLVARLAICAVASAAISPLVKLENCAVVSAASCALEKPTIAAVWKYAMSAGTMACSCVNDSASTSAELSAGMVREFNAPVSDVDTGVGVEPDTWC